MTRVINVYLCSSDGSVVRVEGKSHLVRVSFQPNALIPILTVQSCLSTSRTQELSS